jgi:hypothetical protein
MLEPIMFVGIGFVAAMLLTLGIIPLVHARAVRLTERRLQGRTPLPGETPVDKNPQRAEADGRDSHTVTTR